MTDSAERTVLLDAAAIERTLKKLALEIASFSIGWGDLMLVGIQRRGVQLAERLGVLLAQQSIQVPLGALDITLYRDDLETIGPRPLVGETRLPEKLEDHCVVIVDDVLYTGRTVRAALNELTDFGRPRRIGLCVLIDRGGRELPIQADIVGQRVEVEARDRVDVLVSEVDGRDAVELVKGPST